MEALSDGTKVIERVADRATAKGTWTTYSRCAIRSKLERMGVQGNFTIEASNDVRGTVLTVTGELDLASSPALEEELERAHEAGAQLVVVDLRELEFMDSTGLNALVKAHQQAQEAGRRFGLVQGSPQVQRLLSLTGLDDRVMIVDAPEDLLSLG